MPLRSTFQRSSSSLAALALLTTLSSSAHADFFGKVAKAITAPARVILHGDIKELPKVIVTSLTGPVIDKAATLIGGSVGQTIKDAQASGPLAIVNLTNVQFIHAVMGIKALKSSGALKNNDECRQLAVKVATVVSAAAGGQLSQMTGALGDAACDTAIPIARPAPGEVIQPPALVQIPTEAQNALGVAPGFGEFNYRVRPIAQCMLFQFPGGGPSGPFLILSDYTAANWNPMSMSWIPVAQLWLDGTGTYWAWKGPWSLPCAPALPWDCPCPTQPCRWPAEVALMLGLGQSARFELYSGRPAKQSVSRKCAARAIVMHRVALDYGH
jgi:hypothetical protein